MSEQESIKCDPENTKRDWKETWTTMQTQRVASRGGYVDDKTDRCWDGLNDRMIEELQARSACDCAKNISWKDKRLHCAVRRSLGEILEVYRYRH